LLPSLSARRLSDRLACAAQDRRHTDRPETALRDADKLPLHLGTSIEDVAVARAQKPGFSKKPGFFSGENSRSLVYTSDTTEEPSQPAFRRFPL
jgi:hypothetical protein